MKKFNLFYIIIIVVVIANIFAIKGLNSHLVTIKNESENDIKNVKIHYSTEFDNTLIYASDVVPANTSVSSKLFIPEKYSDVEGSLILTFTIGIEPYYFKGGDFSGVNKIDYIEVVNSDTPTISYSDFIHETTLPIPVDIR